MPDTADIVLFTVNDHETRETQAAFGAPKPAVPNGGYRYWHYGEIGGARVVHAECRMADLPAGKVARSAMDAWQPGLLIAVGIAWGANRDKQAIGEILLADPLRDAANHADRGGRIEPRGQPFALPDNLRQIVKTCHRDWRDADAQSRPKLRIGEVISMPKLLDNSAERKRWIDALPEAIGGEMEGRGMVDAAVEHKCDWLVLKAICDWGEDKNVSEPKKENDQALAAQNAARLLRFAVEHGLGAFAVDARRHRAVSGVPSGSGSNTIYAPDNQGVVVNVLGTLNMGVPRND